MSQKTALKNRWPKSKKSWKSVQSDSKAKQKTKLGLVILAVILLIVIFGKLIQFAGNLYKPLDSTASISQQFYWNGNSTINILVHGNQYGVVSFNPNEQTIKVINIPEDTYIPVARSFGSWKVRSIYGLGESEGNKLLGESISNLFGIPLDGYIEITGKNKDQSILQTVENIRKSPFNFVTSIGEIRTNMTLLDLSKYAWRLAGVRFDKVTEIDLHKRGVMEKDYLPDKTEIFKVDYSRLDSLIQSFADTNLLNERISVAIFNATSTPGLAQKYARFVSNLGINVITVSNTETKMPKTIVLPNQLAGEEVLNSYSLEKLHRVFSLDCSKGLKCDIIDCKSKSIPLDCQISDSKVSLSRAQINIIIGEDFIQTF